MWLFECPLSDPGGLYPSFCDRTNCLLIRTIQPLSVFTLPRLYIEVSSRRVFLSLFFMRVFRLKVSREDQQWKSIYHSYMYTRTRHHLPKPTKQHPDLPRSNFQTPGTSVEFHSFFQYPVYKEWFFYEVYLYLSKLQIENGGETCIHVCVNRILNFSKFSYISLVHLWFFVR